jgi:catechol 2,3-dioxygenase-like lactoylglutathione lyase family enzyme
MLRGLATISFWADDVKAARAWYSELLGIAPYFERLDAANPAGIIYNPHYLEILAANGTA